MDRADKPRRGSYFLAAQHQLRQPLNALSLLIGELRQAADGRDREAIVDDMRYALDLSNAWLDSLADLEKAEEGLLRLQPQDLPLNQIFARLRDEFLPHFSHLGLDFRVVPTRAVVRADPVALRRLLSLLLDNAAKFTRDGKILLGCRRRRNKLRIEVWDTGLGIPESERQKIFEEFHQIDNPARERQRGIGLGLSIVRRLANILGHEIFLHSVRGQGSVFAVELDLTGKSIDLSQRGSGRSPAGMRENATVLVLDDDLQVRKGMVRALESWGCRVKAAEDYATAAKVVSEMPAGVDLIVADYRLPNGCNGVRAVGRLRMLAGRMVPVLIVTADQGEEEMREITEQGFPTLQKPVDPDALALAVTGLLEGFADRGLKETGD